ncbi:MAG: hypothetical protein KC592_14205 [Nitrospira sp.]|nr:hypothetical protein [Nitrospira sp.]
MGTYVAKKQSTQRQRQWTRGNWVKWLKNPTVLKALIIIGRLIVWMVRQFKAESS